MLPQFSLKRLFVSVTLIAVGCGMLAILFSPWLHLKGETGFQIGAGLWFGGGCLICSGIGALWDLGYGILIGTVIGVMIQGVILGIVSNC
jgi:hypothetical protein